MREGGTERLMNVVIPMRHRDSRSSVLSMTVQEALQDMHLLEQQMVALMASVRQAYCLPVTMTLLRRGVSGQISLRWRETGSQRALNDETVIPLIGCLPGEMRDWLNEVESRRKWLNRRMVVARCAARELSEI